MTTLDLLSALDSAHDQHDEGCDCFERLGIAVRGRGLFFPPVEYGCAPAPQIGCETQIAAFARGVEERISRAWFADASHLFGVGLGSLLVVGAPDPATPEGA